MPGGNDKQSRFDLSRPLILRKGDSCELLEMNSVERKIIKDANGHPATQIVLAEFGFAVQRAGHKRRKIHWRYGRSETERSQNA